TTKSADHAFGQEPRCRPPPRASAMHARHRQKRHPPNCLRSFLSPPLPCSSLLSPQPSSREESSAAQIHFNPIQCTHDPCNHQIEANHASEPLAARQQHAGGGVDEEEEDPSIWPRGGCAAPRAVQTDGPHAGGEKPSLGGRRALDASPSIGLRIPTMESPPLKLNVGRGEDRISALPDELLLRTLERLALRDAVRAGAVSTRWRHLPHQLSLVALGIRHFRRATLAETMDAFAAALLSVCPPAERHCECQRSYAIKDLRLCFYPSAPHLSSIGRTVEDVLSCGRTESLEFLISLLPGEYTPSQLAEFGQQLMSFSRAYQDAFRCLTRLSLKGLAFGDSDLNDLIRACDKLKCLTLRSCRLVHRHSVLKIDTPFSGLQELEFIHFVCRRIELISVPKLSKVDCHWSLKNPPVRFGYVPELCEVSLTRQPKVWKAPFLLSKCLSRSATNLSKLHLNFYHQMVKLISLSHINFFYAQIICSSLPISVVYLCSFSSCRFGFSRNNRTSSLLYSAT
uniref:F-box domain-containing protein n=1 Tax=Aegilops tauschii subsp. strangulata TaxID=200361 RepID=A0A453MET6_AEGTS